MAANEPGTGLRVPDAVFQEATRWFGRLREADVSPRTRKRFQRWLDHDAGHADAYAQAERLWGALDGPAKRAAARNEEEIEALIASARRPARGRVLVVALALALCAAGAWWRRGGLDDLRATYVTAPGDRQRYVLDDGTILDLNTDTAVAIDLRPERRSIRMFRGEAFFAVAHDASRPFVVSTPEGKALDVGTAFNVRIRDDETIVSVVEGEVEASAADDPASRAQLRPGEQTAVARAAVGPVRPFKTAAATWRTGQIAFFRTPLGEVVDELNRYRRGRIVIFGEGLRTLPVTGVFSTRDPAEAISVIEATLGVTAIRLTGALTILR